MAFVYKADPTRGMRWKALFEQSAPDVDFHVWPETGDPAKVRFLATWVPPDDILQTFPNLEVIFSVGAGIDQIDLAKIPSHIPVVRMIEPAVTDRMIEYVTHAVLSIHRRFPTYERHQRESLWKPLPNQLSGDIRICVLGLGELGQAVISRLKLFGYSCSAWSRTQKDIAGVACFSGADGLREVVPQADILICLLPLTAETHGILSRELLGSLPRGASLVQTGRGAHLDLSDLLALLDSGHLESAHLDVFDPEPLPADHVLWRHPKVRITPHIASTTHPDSAVPVVLENLRRYGRGEALVGQVDKLLGY
jgi:glyoxylate/hydroxypyruvate reductase A